MSFLTTPVRSDNRNSGTDPDGLNTASPQNTIHLCIDTNIHPNVTAGIVN